MSTETYNSQVAKGNTSSNSVNSGILGKGYTAGNGYNSRVLLLSRTYLDTPTSQYVKYRVSVRQTRSSGTIRVNRDYNQRTTHDGVFGTSNIVVQEVNN
jgi:hypothetical protein